MKYDIITVGSAVIDTFIELDIAEKNKQICVPTGAKILVKKMMHSTGGGGTNTAVSFSKMGLKTGFIGKIGTDINSEIILQELKKEKVSFLGKRCNEPTGSSIILDAKERNRTVLNFRGANSLLEEKEIRLDKLKTEWFYFASMTEDSLKVEEKMFEFASKKGIKTAFNPSSYLILKNKKRVISLLKNLYVLILNDEEATDLVGDGDLLKKIHKLGPKIVCITYGKKGNIVSNEEKVHASIPNNIKIVERTGAGDAFASGFVSGFIKFGEIEKAIKVGSVNAESTIQKIGAKNGLLTWNEAVNRMNKIKIKTFEQNQKIL